MDAPAGRYIDGASKTPRHCEQTHIHYEKPTYLGEGAEFPEALPVSLAGTQLPGLPVRVVDNQERFGLGRMLPRWPVEASMTSSWCQI